MISKTTTRKPTEPKLDVKMDITILSTTAFGTSFLLWLSTTGFVVIHGTKRLFSYSKYKDFQES